MKGTKRTRRIAGKGALVILVLVLLLALSSYAIAPFEGEETTKGWTHEDFDENIRLTYSPHNPGDSDGVVVRIESRENVSIKNAYIYFPSIEFPNGLNYSDTAPFVPVNDTVMESSIQPYENGTHVSFYVVAWDWENNVITSMVHSYTVTGVVYQGWGSGGFHENVEIYHIPAEPLGGQNVMVVIWSKNPDVMISGAHLWIKKKARGQSEQVGGFEFHRVNATEMVSEIHGYGVGTEITFWVETWDKDVRVLTSNESGYTITTYGYEEYGFEAFPQASVYGGYVASLIVSILVIIYFIRTLGRMERESLNQKE
ncbi:MAG: hypothetical protein KAI64_03905 [Thermoplasmata archaeon]|nr:hypothetical protein [Thermoplasmata archaeon]